MKAQRLRFRYRVTTDAGSPSNRDLVKVWQDAVTAAGYPVAFSEGKRPAPQIALAAPLPLGVTSDCELADVFLDQLADPVRVLKAVAAHLPQGIEVMEVREIGVDAASLQSQLRLADYEAFVPPGVAGIDDFRRRAAELLAADTLPAEYTRTNKVKSYDLRPLVLSLEVSEAPEGVVIRMRLRAEQDRTARADQVLLALRVEEARIHRTRLELEEIGGALQAFRRAGEPGGDELQ